MSSIAGVPAIASICAGTAWMLEQCRRWAVAPMILALTAVKVTTQMGTGRGLVNLRVVSVRKHVSV